MNPSNFAWQYMVYYCYRPSIVGKPDAVETFADMPTVLSVTFYAFENLQTPKKKPGDQLRVSSFLRLISTAWNFEAREI